MTHLKFLRIDSHNHFIAYREGDACDHCIPLGGCLYGGCTNSFECDCNLANNQTLRGKYTGTHCDIRMKHKYFFIVRSNKNLEFFFL